MIIEYENISLYRVKQKPEGRCQQKNCSESASKNYETEKQLSKTITLHGA